MPAPSSSNHIATHNVTRRPPVVTILGHIDHGKSTLLDYIRKTSTVLTEAGGITQHLGAYEATIKNSHGENERITFIDTPGHEAFSAMRLRGAVAADIAILVVAADDGVKQQTLEALTAIQKSARPFIVAVNKIDKDGANTERTINQLAEHEVYLEGRGGSTPYTLISAKTGSGVTELLELILLVAEVEGLTATLEKSAEGVVIEANIDAKKGKSGTLLIKDGTLRRGGFVASEGSFSPVRIMENFAGEAIENAGPSSPVRIIGWSSIPSVGAPFLSFETKRAAEECARNFVEKVRGEQKGAAKTLSPENEIEKTGIPIIIKTDTAGGIDALRHEIQKIVALAPDIVDIKIVRAEVGTISLRDLKLAETHPHTLIVGFHTTTDSGIPELADRSRITLKTFDIIYELVDWLTEGIRTRTPKQFVEKVAGQIKILKIFSTAGNKQVLGGRIVNGMLSVGDQIRIVRRDNPIGPGKIIELQVQRVGVQNVKEGECGLRVDSKHVIATGDVLESVTMVEV